VKIATDESGNYGLGSQRFESYVLCPLIVPDSRLDAVERFVDDACRRWGRRELKSSAMKPPWISEVAEFLAGHQIAAVAYVTDNEMMTRPIVAEFRLHQAAAIAKGRSRVLAANPDYPGIAAIDQLLDRVAGAATHERISDDDFIHSEQVPELVLETVRRACLRYSGPEWDEEFERFRFVFDAKQTGRLKAGERFIDEHLERMIGSTERMKLDLPFVWRTGRNIPFGASMTRAGSTHR
jgi:hypothetical protein